MMRRIAMFTLAAALVLFAASVVPAGAGPSHASTANEHLQMYVVITDQAGADAIKAGGYGIASVEGAPNGQVRLEVVAYPSDQGALKKFGEVQLWRNADGLTSSELAAQQSASGFKVWRDYDGPDGLEQYMHDLENANPDILDLEVIGQSRQGRDVLALRLTNEANNVDKPAVLYSSLTHAREWISGEVNRRLLEWFIKGWREVKPAVVDIMNTTELWFVLVENPDGYQYTFDHERLWRKNLNDNDGNGEINSLDGVDLNRNFPEHWNYDDEGSGSIFSGETYRGRFPASEPETRAMIGL